jgi:hypothetical protein
MGNENQVIAAQDFRAAMGSFAAGVRLFHQSP